ncbi:hypothetical protein BCV70DRAFT_143055, partial [Testicularia cyperi]
SSTHTQSAIVAADESSGSVTVNASVGRRNSAFSEQSFYSAADVPSHRRRKQPRVALHPSDQPASFSFVCLGTGGGPLEGDCSCYLLKPADAAWQDGSVVVEGGSWLGALTDVLEQHGPDSAFYDFDFPSTTPSAYLRAGLMASFSQAFLISHAHLDHILGLVLGSASLPGKRAVYGLKPTLENILDMFNGKIWPKLASWKEDEPYTMYHMRSLDHQRPHSVHELFSVLPFALSHGLNPSVPPAPPTPTYTPAPLSQSYFSKRNSLPLSTQMASFQLSRSVDERARAMDNAGHNLDRLDATTLAALRRPSFNSPFAPPGRQQANGTQQASETLSAGHAPNNRPGEPVSPRASAAKAASASGGAASTSAAGKDVSNLTLGSTAMAATGRSASPSTRTAHTGSGHSAGSAGGPPERPPKSRRPRTAQGSERHAPPPSAWSTAAPGQARQPPRRVSIDRTPPSLDSTAFFITHKGHDRDVLFFGDVEPDCVSKSPRNKQVWSHAAERFADGKLSAIFLECSFPKHHPTEFLYGHLSVEHLFDELRVLAQMVKRYRERSRRSSNASNRSGGHPSTAGGSGSGNGGGGGGCCGKSKADSARHSQHFLAPSPLGTAAVSTGEGDQSDSEREQGGQVYDRDSELRGQLAGLGVIIIHVKPALFPSYVQEDSVPASPTSATASSSASSAAAAAHGHGEQQEGDEDANVSARDCKPAQLDPRTAPQKILDELNQEEHLAQLGVRFVMAEKGMRIEC